MPGPISRFFGSLAERRNRCSSASPKPRRSIAFCWRAATHLGLIHTGTDRLDRPIGAQALERAEGTVGGFLIVIIRIMDQQYVNVVEPETARLSSTERITPS